MGGLAANFPAEVTIAILKVYYHSGSDGVMAHVTEACKNTGANVGTYPLSRSLGSGRDGWLY